MNPARTTTEAEPSIRAVGDVATRAPRGARERATCLCLQRVWDFHVSGATAS